MPSVPTRLPRLAAGLTGAALLFPAFAGAAPLQIEQVNRATGTAGATTLANLSSPLSRAEAITSDGRYSYFEDRLEPFAASEFTSVRALDDGLYRRDIVANRTTKIAGGDAVYAGLDDPETTLAFTTTERLSSADTNELRDLYSVTGAGAPVLLSRAPGRNGAAVGVTNGATLTRAGNAAIFENDGGVYRRDLAAGTTTRIQGAGQFVGQRYEGTMPTIAPENTSVSTDGRIVATTSAIITPARTIPIADGQGAPVPIGPYLSRSGDRAIYQENRVGVEGVRIVNTTTGRITAPAVPDELKGGERSFSTLIQASPYAYAAVVGRYVISDDGKVKQSVLSWNLETGAVTDLGVPASRLSTNGKYALTSGGGGGGSVVAFAAPGRVLPGTVDLPSPTAYASLYDACGYDPVANAPARVVQVGTNYLENLPKAKRLRIEAFDAAGTRVVDRTVNVPTALGYDPSLITDAPVGSGAYKLRFSVRFADDRLAVETTSNIARSCTR